MKSLHNETNDACSKSNNWTPGRAKKKEWEKRIPGLFECQISFPKKYFHTYLFDLATHLRKIGFPQNWPWFPLHRERERERTCSIKEISTNFMQIMGKYRENIRKEQRELILKVVPIIWFELLTLELGQGLIWHFLSINNHWGASQNSCRPPCPPPWRPHQ